MACRSMLRSAIIVEPFQFQFKPLLFNLNPNKRVGFRYKTIKARPFHRGSGSVLRCSHNDKPSFQDDQGPPQEAVLKAISEVSKTEGRIGQTTNMVIGGTVTDDSTNEWVALDKKGSVKHKLSARGKYVSVNIGPVQVISSEQVQAVYNAMRRDDRMKYFL
ncbi:hypothetical protein TSUD_326020 [Trifolium subterraneum]|uniref:Uncharacterized protein n=1 Tax=Trifolium subterraneum TaxID=3900 RepID=A0A2Z6M4A6_TRISU|nr:hypothetical protein TSUD_326020 [Trifolium subterraneum]